MPKKKESTFISRMEVSAQQLGEMAIESDGRSVMFIATEKVENGHKIIGQFQGDTQGLIQGLVEFATDPETAPIFKEVLNELNKI